MTVAELIERLSLMPPDAVCVVPSEYSIDGAGDVLNVELFEDRVYIG